jgi:2-oxoglutarate dehydrogenase E1 component
VTDLTAFYGPNAGYVLDLYERYQRDPASVDPATRAFFETWRPPGPEAAALPSARLARATPVSPTGDLEGREAARGAAALAGAIRNYGHLAARLDPLGSEPPGDRELDPTTHGITEADLAALPASVVGGPAARGLSNALEAIQNLRRIYCGTTGYDYDHIHKAEERAWLRDAAEIGRFRVRMTTSQKEELLQRLTQVEAFEQFLHRTFTGQKRFSIEGADMLVPMLDQVIRCQTQRGNREVVMGMAHRGRLNILAHVLEKPYGAILTEFERPGQHPNAAASDHGDAGWTGDVKYHLGARWPGRGTVVQVSITLVPNPSHLEFVNPVVEGMTRAAQESREHPGPPTQNLEAALPILIHGDAAFPAEGIVAETLNLSRLSGYQTGGTIHIIVNNQIGFTTEPADARSTLYASDLAKGFEIPIVHVNADDPEACLAAARLACAYRDEFHKDFLIDLVSYRRWGHNEGDEPAFTQPRMYDLIRSHPTVRQLWAQELGRQGITTQQEAEALFRSALNRLEKLTEDAFEAEVSARRSEEQTARDALEERTGGDDAHAEPGSREEPVTAVPAERLRTLNEELLRWPEGFTLHPRLERPLQRRRTGLDPGGRIDWAHAETLAFASILADGTPIRLTGQDTERGTFSQRHLVLHDTATGATFVPLQALPAARASFALYNSPLSESAPLGFEYGYSAHSSEVLVLWEAQFGDFVNVAQPMVDQFIVSARAKWEQTPDLVLLLPHGYEGQGPEHSSARLERFLQLAAGDNLRVVNCTTSAQYFHLLRRQAELLARDPRPLVVMSPKSLLRHPGAASTAEELTQGQFQRVIADRWEGTPTRLILCSGKFYYDLIGGSRLVASDSSASSNDGGSRNGERTASRSKSLAVVARVEELYPFPRLELEQLLANLPKLREVVWAQEEPQNMGAWSYMEPRLRELLGPQLTLEYVGRPRRASPAEGSAETHAREQARIVAEAWGREAATRQPSVTSRQLKRGRG